MDNNEIMNVLLTYDNLKELSYKDNILTYQGKSINISSVNIGEFLINPYSQMFLDQKTISSSDFFNIMLVHSKLVEFDEEEIKKEKDIDDLNLYALDLMDDGKINSYDVINVKHYFTILNKNSELSPIENERITNFEIYVATLLEYEDYLLDDQRQFLNSYRHNIIVLADIEEDETENTINNNQKNAVNKFFDMVEYVKNRNNQKIRKLKKKNDDASLGYINAFIVLLTLIAAGIVIGICGFFILD